MHRIVSIAALLAALACAPAGSDLAKKHDGKYVGAGSVWEWGLKADGTFTATEKTTRAATEALLSITGTYETFPTGFYRFTVGSATGANAPAAGEKAFGFGVPGVILIVKPTGEDAHLMPMPAIGACPTATTEFNWVQGNAEKRTGDLSTFELWGRASLPTSGDITGKSFIFSGTVGAQRTFAATTGCANGFIDVGTDGFMTMTQAGVGILAGGDTLIIAVPRDTSVTATSLAGKEFVGLAFTEDGDGGDVLPLNLSFPASGAGTYKLISDVTTGATKESGSIEVSERGADDKAGFLKLVVDKTKPDHHPEMWAATVPDIGGTGHTFFFATGMNVPQNQDAFSVIAVQK